MLLVIAVILAITAAVHLSNVALFEEQADASSQNYLQSKVFWFNHKKQLTFSIPANSNQVRILLTAEQSHVQEQNMLVTFLLQGKSTKKLQENVVFSSPNKQEQSDKSGLRYFDRVGSINASLSFEKLFNISKGVKKLTIEIESHEFNVAARVYSLENLSQPKAELIWKRAHPNERQALLLPHIYPADLVKEEERQTSLSTRWGTLGPDGVDGVDYQSGVLLVNKEQQEASIKRQTSGQIRIGKNRIFTYHNNAGINFNALSCHSDFDNNVSLAISSIAAETEELKKSVLNIATNEKIAIEGEPTAIQFSSDKPCRLRFYNSLNEEIQLEQNRRTSIYLTDKKELSYRLKLNSSSLQAIRIDVRGILLKDDPSDKLATVELQLHDQSGNLIERYSRELSLVENPFEYIEDIAVQKKITANNSYYIKAPKDAFKFSVKVNGIDALVRVYARPLELPIYFTRQYQIDSAIDNIDESATKSTQVWFGINPIETNSSIIKLQTLWNLPLERKLANRNMWRNQWVSLLSDDFVTNNVFYLENRTIDTPSITRFVQIKNRESLLFATPYNNNNIKPQLVIIRNTQQPEELSVQINNSEVVSTWIAGKVSVINLPRISAGRHDIAIKANNINSYYINYVTLNSFKSAHKVAAVPINNGVVLNLQKQAEEESITLRYFSKIKTPHQVIISLNKVNDFGLSNSLTLPTRVINYIPTNNSNPSMVYLLEQPTQWIDSATVLHFPLKSDLPPGKYKLTIKSTVDNSGYIQAGYLLDEITGKAVLFTEEQDND
ncbi:hypothetical protein ACUR5C_08405 [Aliikangiella sp. IMCC44653]